MCSSLSKRDAQFDPVLQMSRFDHPPLVAITGATGFLGSHLCRFFADQGYRVRALVRRPDIQVPYAEAVFAPLDDRGAIQSALEDVSAVVHAAGLAHQQRPDPSHMFEANVTATELLAQAAVAARVSTFVFLSSVSAGRSLHDPDDGTAYGQTKRLAEHRLTQLASQSSLRVVILRPVAVYGPHMKGNPARLFRWIHRGFPLPIIARDTRRSLVFIGNVVAAVQRALECANLQGTYVVSDANTPTLSELGRHISRSLGRSPRIVHVPHRLIAMLGKVGDFVPARLNFPLTTRTLSRIGETLSVDGTALWASTYGEPPYTWQDGIAETARWYVSTNVS